MSCQTVMLRRSCALLVLLAVVFLACAVRGDQPSVVADASQEVNAGSPDAGSAHPEETTTTASVDGDAAGAASGGADEPAQPLDAETEAIRQRIEGMNDEELKELLAQQEERLAALQAHIANTTDDGTADDSALDEGEVEDEISGDDDAGEGEGSASSEMDALVGVLNAFKRRLVASQPSTRWRFGSADVLVRIVWSCSFMCTYLHVFRVSSCQMKREQAAMLPPPRRKMLMMTTAVTMMTTSNSQMKALASS
jgi:hypothetical protein